MDFLYLSSDSGVPKFCVLFIVLRVGVGLWAPEVEGSPREGPTLAEGSQCPSLTAIQERIEI